MNEQIESMQPSTPPSSSSSLSYSSIPYGPSQHKSLEWLNEIHELNYFPYNSCNSLTIYSYKYWQSENKLLVATKENNLKEVYFKTMASASEFLDSADTTANTTCILSNQSSTSSGSVGQTGLPIQSNDEANRTKSSSTEEYKFSSTNNNLARMCEDSSYLMPVLKIHKFTKIKSKCM
jgi:hypothetical protein